MKAKAIIPVLLMMLFCTGCWSSREINTLAITICLGIDKTDEGYLITKQVLNPTALAMQKGSDEDPVVLFVQKGENLFSALRKIATESSRKMYNSHVRVVVLGENLAREGIKDILDFFMREHEFRTDFYYVIAKGTTANEVLGILTPLESVPGVKLYLSLENSERYWGITSAINSIFLVQSILADGINPVLPGIEIISKAGYSEMENSNDAKRLQYTGMGVFQEDKLIGWLSEDEAKGYHYIIGDVGNYVEQVYYNGKDQIVCEVRDSQSKMIASCKDDKPSVCVKIKTSLNIAAVEGVLDITKQENRKILKELLEKRIKLLCEKVQKKAQQELHSDIFGFGEAIHRREPKLWKKLKDSWDTEYVKLPVHYDITVEIKQAGQISKPMFLKEGED